MTYQKAFSQETLIWLGKNVFVPDGFSKDRHYWRRTGAYSKSRKIKWRCLKCGIVTTTQDPGCESRPPCKVAEQHFES